MIKFGPGFSVSAAALLLSGMVTTAAAQNYPVKPIRFYVGFAAGGSNDLVARALAIKLSEIIGQSVVVENRGGANTSIATEMVSRAAPDGYTILLNAPGHATNPALMKLNFDPLRDFSFISLASEAQNIVVVHPSFPPRSIKELIAFSKIRPNTINFASSGTGTTVHLSAELFQFMTGVKWIHVPYKGGGPAAIELIAGQTSLMFANMPTAIDYARAGRLRALAVTGARRAPAVPDLPTVAESGVAGFEVTTWTGVSAPAKTPRAIIDKLNADINRALNTAELRNHLTTQGADPTGSTPEQYTTFMQNEIVKWGKVIKAAGIKGDQQ
jgi:tripartite-type tricarboxylate transporter receptor subunit TctC